MSTWMVSYADAAFRRSQARLMASGEQFGIDVPRCWDRKALQRTRFYKSNQVILDESRGGGYWLWKPFIIAETLQEMAPGDVLVYCDSGIEIIADLHPLLEICPPRTDMMLFAGHYEEVGSPGPNVCGKWTKRDCFILMDCDQEPYYQSQMVDASFLLVAKTAHSSAFVREWLDHCCHPPLLTDAPNVCGAPNLPQFIAHRHDQSILSLLAARARIDLFRHPSQHGNHAKAERDRQAGEWTRHPYRSKGLYENSPYKTLLNHHRGMLSGDRQCLCLHRTISAPRDHVFRAWTDTRLIRKWRPLGSDIVSADADVRTGGWYRIELVAAGAGASACERVQLEGSYLDVQPPALLTYSGPENTLVRVEFEGCNETTVVTVVHEGLSSEPAHERYAMAWKSFLEIVALETALGGGLL